MFLFERFTLVNLSFFMAFLMFLQKYFCLALEMDRICHGKNYTDSRGEIRSPGCGKASFVDVSLGME